MTNFINARTNLGGAIYPFLHRLNRRWAIISHDVNDPDTPRTQSPALRWINGSDVYDLYVEGADTAQFLAETGLQLSLDKGGFVLSKRISRLMRPYFMSGFFAADEIRVTYLDQDARDQKIWDGAGQISRDLLLRLIDHLPSDLTDRKRRYLMRELKTVGRVEFTLMTARGQDKGHCLVMDDLDADFVLPRDTKTQVRLTDGTAFVGLMPVHSRDHMRLDIQSLVNLWPFFETPQLAEWLRREGDLFLEGVRSGEIADVMTRLDSDLVEIESWHVREYLACGGHPLWFGAIAKAIINQHLRRLHHSTLGKMRLPVPGGRYYVMTDAVGGRDIPLGHVTLDPDTATAWVNADDWCAFIADVLGGADQDDALWCFPFTDHDGTRKILCWRSPNQVGEYVLLRPTEDCHAPEWSTADSRKLPPRIDTQTVDYLNLVDPDSGDGLGEGQPYSIAAMRSTISRAIANRGALGQYCNLLLLAQAVYGRLPKNPPAPLEDVIDASVKTGADLSRVRDWCEQASAQIIAAGTPVPAILHDRLSSDEVPVASRDHWLDGLVAAVRDHIAFIKERRDFLSAQANPPETLFQHALQDDLSLGARFNQIYTGSLPWRGGGFESARERCEAFLAQYESDQQRAILRSALAHAHLNNGADGAAWQIGAATDDGRAPGIAQITLDALREIGLLDEIASTDDGVIVYPGAKILPTARTVTLIGVWFNWLCAYRKVRGERIPDRMGDLSPDAVAWAKDQIAALSFDGLTLTIYCENGRKIAYTPHGNIFAYVAREEHDRVGATITLKRTLHRNGDLIALI